jgi:UDP-N-acetylmuramoylalanine--D-glutamate ligase
MTNLQALTVLVLGLGDSGLAMAAWCARHGAAVRVWDSRETPPQAEALALAVPSATLATGALGADALAGVQLVLKSPGLAPTDERIAPLLAAARAQGLAIQGELDLFARALADLKAERDYAPQVVAVTGTNGKTTTTALTALLIERCGRVVAAAWPRHWTRVRRRTSRATPSRCPRSGCSSCRASSSTASPGSSRLPQPCST